MKKYNVILLMAVVISGITAIIDLVGPYMLGKIVETLGNGDFVLSLIWVYGILIILGKILDSCHGFIVEWYNMKATETVRYKAVQWMLQRRKYGKKPYDDGDVVSRLTSDVDAVTQLLASPLNGLIPQILTGIGALIILWTIHWLIAILVIVVLPFFYYLTKKVNSVSKKNAKTNREIRASMTSYFMDFVKNYRIYVCYDGRETEESRSAQIGHDLTRNGIKQSTNMLTYFICVSLLRCTVILVSLLILYRPIITGDIGSGTVIMVVSYVQNVFLPVLQLSRYVNQVAQANVSLQRVFDLEPEHDYIGEFKEFQGEHIRQLNVRDLTIAYGQEKNVVENVNFNIYGPGLVCLYGRSGSGKSTILHTMCGLLPLKRGSIKVNGMDYSERLLELVLERKTRIVFQDSFLLDRTLKENIIYGADKNLEENKFMLEIGHKLGLNLLLEDLDRNVHDARKGSSISGGERKRIALMRGLNQHADIYLLDEPTSGLDKESAQLVVSLIKELKHKAIVIVSTHDDAFKELADCIVNV